MHRASRAALLTTVLLSLLINAPANGAAFETLTAYLQENDLDLPDLLTDSAGNVDWVIKPPDFIPKKSDYFVIDVRPDSVYEKGHIPGAVRSSFRNLLTTAKQAGSKPIVVVCHTGQAAGFAAVALRLRGYDNAKVLAFGMSIWNDDFDIWSSHVSDTAVSHANWVSGAAASPQTFGNPTITTSKTDGAAILAERVKAMLEGGPKMVAGGTVLNAPQDYFVNVYLPEDTLLKYGHVDGGYRIMETLGIESGGLENLDPSETIVTYCYTGQTAAFVTAYLTVLGYDARFMAFGMNGMIYSQMESTKWPGTTAGQAYTSGSPFEMLAAYINNHDLDIADIYFSGGNPSWIIPANMVSDDPSAFYIMDIRPDSVYDKGHIEGAVNVKLPFVVDSAANAGTKPIVVACHTGQGAAYAVTALRLSGYATAKSMKWGMSAWNEQFDIWSPNTSDTGDGHANWSTAATAALDTFDHPEFSTLETDTAEVLKERVAAMLAGGPGKLPAGMALANPGAFQINVYWPPDSVTKYGHIAGAYNLVGPNLAVGSGGLVHVDAGRTVVSYCWTGQTAAALSAYLAVLGYDTKFIVFGANAMIYSALPSGPYKWAGPADYAYVPAAGIADAWLFRAMAPVTLRRLSNGQMVLEINADGDYTARLFDLTGSRIGSHTQSGRGSWRIGTESVSSGSYILKVNSNGTEIRRRVMVYR